MISIGCWNTWGLNSLRKQLAIQKWIQMNNLHFVGLIETKTQPEKLAILMHKLGLQGWSTLANSAVTQPSRIMVSWNPHTHSIQEIDQSSQWITCSATNKATKTSLTITVVYGLNSPSERIPLWNYIQNQGSIITNPWIILGDFNAIMHPWNRAGGTTAWPRHMEDFPESISKAELIHLPYTGPNLTWHNGQVNGRNIQKKLDWAFGNHTLLQSWPATRVNFQPRLISDHSGMFVHIQPHLIKAAPPIFKFINAWADRADFMATVEGVWQNPIRGNPMFILTSKLQILRTVLKKYHKQNTSAISTRVNEAKQNWKISQYNLDLSPTDPIRIQNERHCAAA
ncbi:hypothetical protein OIU77_028031, partial [Salix suchowensis]